MNCNFVKCIRLFWLSTYLHKDAFTISSSSKVGLPLLETQRGVAKKLTHQLNYPFPQLWVREPRGQAGHSIPSWLWAGRGTLDAIFHGLSHLILMIVLWAMWRYSPFYQYKNWDTLSFNILFKLANIKSRIYTQVILISNPILITNFQSK